MRTSKMIYLSVVISLLAALACRGITGDSTKDVYQVATSSEMGSYNGLTYEFWNQDNQGHGKMVLRKDGTFNVSWSSIKNLLGRIGIRPGKNVNSVEYKADYYPAGTSYLCVYGWTKNPLVEYYIVENWHSWKPPQGTSLAYNKTTGFGHKGTVKIDGATYDIYTSQRVNQPSIVGTETFTQFWSVRRNRRNSGVIDVKKHFTEWAKFGMKMGTFYEVSFCIEGYKSSGSADVKKLVFNTQ